MSSIGLMEKVARHELTASEAVDQMQREAAEARRIKKPEWMPSWAWSVCLFAGFITLSVLGADARRSD